jgi:DNA-binding response OmpR family regulator
MFASNKRVLMIENDSMMATAISDTLKKHFMCSVDIAHDPYEAMNFMSDSFYNMIFLDWQLPGLNGTETLLQTEKGLSLEPELPEQWDRSTVPVVIFSSTKKNNCSFKPTKYFNFGGFISKTHSFRYIISTLGSFILDKRA